jgi:hypothetical protein
MMGDTLMQIDIKKGIVTQVDDEEEKLYSISFDDVDKRVFNNILPGYEIEIDREKLSN